MLYVLVLALLVETIFVPVAKFDSKEKCEVAAKAFEDLKKDAANSNANVKVGCLTEDELANATKPDGGT